MRVFHLIDDHEWKEYQPDQLFFHRLYRHFIRWVVLHIDFDKRYDLIVETPVPTCCGLRKKTTYSLDLDTREWEVWVYKETAEGNGEEEFCHRWIEVGLSGCLLDFRPEFVKLVCERFKINEIFRIVYEPVDEKLNGSGVGPVLSHHVVIA